MAVQARGHRRAAPIQGGRPRRPLAPDLDASCLLPLAPDLCGTRVRPGCPRVAAIPPTGRPPRRLALSWRRRQDAAVPELLADLAAAAVQPGHDGADRGAHDLRDLPVRVALDVGQVDRGTELV